MLGYKKSQLYYYFKKIGKHIRNRKEYIQTDFFKNQLNNMKVTDEDIEQKILELYVDEQKTSNEIAKKLNLSPTTIVRVINKYDSMRSSKEIWDVPGARKRMSDTKIKFWKEVGKLPGLLRRYKNKEDALNYLHGFRNRMGKRWGTERGFAMFNKYLPIVESLPSKLDIINDQTYPDKIKQPITTPETSQQTTASLSWYKKANKCSGWAAVVCNKTISKKVQDWGKNNISKEELTDDGRETETHVTLIYGICTDNEELVKQIFAEEGKIKASFGKVSFFSKSPDKDTVIIRVISKDLERLHKKIKKELNVETTFPIYQPHCTIAYVKNGEGRKYAGDTYFKGTKIIFDKVVFDNSKDKRTEIKLGK